MLLENSGRLRLPPLLPSQHGEELLVSQYFNNKTSGFFIEVGAYDGVELSNTYYLEALGWDGILVEPNPTLYSKILVNRPYSEHFNVAVSHEPVDSLDLNIVENYEALSYSKATRRHLNRIDKLDTVVTSISVPVARLDELIPDHVTNIDFVSIDVEGAEIDVLKSLDFNKWRPTLIVIEDNSHGKNIEIRDFMQQHDYKEVAHLSSNFFYLSNCSSSPFNSQIFQGY